MLEFLDKAALLFEQIFGSSQAILILIPLALILKLSIIFFLIKNSATTRKNLPYQLLFLIITIGGLIISDVTWFIKTLQGLYHFNYAILLFFIRISWGLTVFQYQGLSLFIDSLTEQHPKFILRQKIFSIISLFFLLFFLYMAITDIGCQSSYARPPIEFSALKIESLYLFFIMMPATLFFSIRRLRSTLLPRILKKQISTLLRVLIIPWFVCEILQALPFNFLPPFVVNSKAVALMSTILITGAIYFSIRKILGLRFLNLKKQVQAPKQTYTSSFIDNFKDAKVQKKAFT